MVLSIPPTEEVRATGCRSAPGQKQLKWRPCSITPSFDSRGHVVQTVRKLWRRRQVRCIGPEPALLFSPVVHSIGTAVFAFSVEMIRRG